MNEIKVSTENVQKAFHAAGENPAIQELLINLFGKENVEPVQKPKDVTERIKTFSDAYNELGEEHPYCIAFDSIYQNDSVILCKTLCEQGLIKIKESKINGL